MVDWLTIREEGEYLISGVVTESELRAETQIGPERSIFDRRLKLAIQTMLDAEESEDGIVVEALVRKLDRGHD